LLHVSPWSKLLHSSSTGGSIMLPSLFDYPGQSDARESNELIFLANWEESQWQKLLEFAELRRFRIGELVISRGEKDRALYIIVKGRLEVLVPGGNRQQRTQIREAGTVIGEQAFLDGKPRSATLRALTDGEMLSLSYERFQILGVHEPELARDMLFELARTLSVKLRQANDFIASLIR
jgi:CRP/FNR family transcriptional regulator, cyclic AMP receptor protein